MNAYRDKEEEIEEDIHADKFVKDGKFPEYQAYRTLHLGYTLLPVIAGVDKFFEVLVNWNRYLAPIIPQFLGLNGQTIMYGVGVIEVAAGIITALRPRLGGYFIAGWFGAIIINLFLVPGFYDIALRDFGLALGAWALAKLSEGFE